MRNVLRSILVAVAFLAVSSAPGSAQSKLVRGSSGDDVVKLQEYLKALDHYQGKVDGKFGASTEAAVKAFQKSNGLIQDGRVGIATWDKLNARKPAVATGTAVMPKLELKSPRMKGPAVQRAQELLRSSGYSVTVDGEYGSGTVAQVKKFQKDNKLPQDGKIGARTWAALTK